MYGDYLDEEYARTRKLSENTLSKKACLEKFKKNSVLKEQLKVNTATGIVTIRNKKLHP